MWVHMPAKPSPYSLDAAPSRQPRPKPFRVEVQLYFVDPSLATDRGGDDDTVVHTVNVAVIAAPPSSLLPPSLPVVAMEHYKETTCRSVAGVVVVVVGDNGRSHEEGGTERGKEGRGVALPAAPPLSLCARALIFSARSKTATRKWPPPRQIVEWTNRTTCADRPTNPPTDLWRFANGRWVTPFGAEELREIRNQKSGEERGNRPRGPLRLMMFLLDDLGHGMRTNVHQCRER